MGKSADPIGYRNRKQANESFKKTNKTCKCGSCANCLDEKRWNEIFQSKHGEAEKKYYTQEPEISLGSSAWNLIENFAIHI